MVQFRPVLALLTVAASLSCQSLASLTNELCREYDYSDGGGNSGILFLGESGRYIFESQGYSCVGAFVPLRYESGIWVLHDNQVFLDPELSMSPGGLHVIRSGRAFILANEYVKPHLDLQLQRWGAVLPIRLGDFRSAGVKLVSEDELRKIRRSPPSAPAGSATPLTPVTPGKPSLPSVPASPDAQLGPRGAG